MRVLPPIWPATLGLTLEGLRTTDVSAPWRAIRVQGPFASNGGGSVGRASGDLDPSRVSLFTPEDRLRLAGLFQKVLDRLPAETTTSRMRSIPRILIERGLSDGHFDPMYWLIGAWFGRKERKDTPVTPPARILALTHFQKEAIRVTRARAAVWIAVNIASQHREIDVGRWSFLHSRRFEVFENLLTPEVMRRTHDHWRSDGEQGGIWFYPRESFRDESPRGRWIVFARVPEPFVYQFTSLNSPGAVVLPGPIPPRHIVKQGPADRVLRKIARDHGGVEAYLRGLETL